MPLTPPPSLPHQLDFLLWLLPTAPLILFTTGCLLIIAGLLTHRRGLGLGGAILFIVWFALLATIGTLLHIRP